VLRARARERRDRDSGSLERRDVLCRVAAAVISTTMNARRHRLTPRLDKQPIDEAFDAYLHWRNRSAEVWDAYRHWARATAAEARAAFGHYGDALQREEQAAHRYGLLVSRLVP
jgi:hypothetical protein